MKDLVIVVWLILMTPFNVIGYVFGWVKVAFKCGWDTADAHYKKIS